MSMLGFRSLQLPKAKLTSKFRANLNAPDGHAKPENWMPPMMLGMAGRSGRLKLQMSWISVLTALSCFWMYAWVRALSICRWPTTPSRALMSPWISWMCAWACLV
jgi:hypothetical protein